jgi:hypothetical protein
VERGEQLAPPLEGVEQRHRAVGADQGGGRVDLDHRQPAAGRRDGVTLAGVRLLAEPELVDLLLPGRAVGDSGRRVRRHQVSLGEVL